MGKIRYAEGLKVLPVVTPANKTSATVESAFIDLKTVNWITYVVHVGTSTGSASSDVLTFTVVSSTASTTNATQTNIPFDYRLSAALGTDLLGAIVAAPAAGYEVLQSAFDDFVLVIDVDPAEIVALDTDALFVQLAITPSGSAANTLGVIAYCEPRYPGNAIPSVSS
jgi:hypothetical protein